MTVLGSNPPGIPTGHPLVRAVAELEALLDHAGSASAWTMTAPELREVLPRLSRVEARVAEMKLRVLREADRQSIGDEVGATNTPAWWAHVTGQPVAAATALAKLAETLDDDAHSPTREALAAGRVHLDQARVILGAVQALPGDVVGPALAADAEAHLVGLADLDGDTRLDPKALRTAGRKILEVVAPEVAEAHEAALLEADERRAAATASLSMRPDGHGSMVGRFKVPVLHGEILAKHLNAIAAPRHQRAVAGRRKAGDDSSADPVNPVSRPLRWGQAFMEYLETRAAATDGSPKAGGVAATIVVTATLEQLLGGLVGSEKPAALDTGELISAGELRRLACEAGIIPAVLGGKSQVLDLGRKRRFHTESQRIAMMLRDGGCAATGCDWPPGMCHAHHTTPWSRGGRTSVQDSALLCPRHHALAHDNRYQLKADKHGKVTFTKRT